MARLLILFLLLTPFSGRAQVFKCEVDGKIVYQGQQCATANETVDVLRLGSNKRSTRSRTHNTDGMHFECTIPRLLGGFERSTGSSEMIVICGQAAGVNERDAKNLRDGVEVPNISPKGVTLLKWVRADNVEYRLELNESMNEIQAATLITPSFGKGKPRVLEQRASSSVKTRIKRRCEVKWAEDYRMQAYCIRKQIEAYNEVNGGS